MFPLSLRFLARRRYEEIDYLFGTGTDAGQEAKSKPELILLDLELPKIGGLALLRRLRAEEHTRRIPVIVLTSNNDHQTAGPGLDGVKPDEPRIASEPLSGSVSTPRHIRKFLARNCRRIHQAAFGDREHRHTVEITTAGIRVR
jgi:CheY-like chemotaxis protein